MNVLGTGKSKYFGSVVRRNVEYDTEIKPGSRYNRIPQLEYLMPPVLLQDEGVCIQEAIAPSLTPQT